MKIGFLATALMVSSAVFAQDAAKPSIDELMEKAIQAVGGRESTAKMTSMVAKGTMEIVSMGGTASSELYAKAPDKRATVIVVDGYGEIRQGYDGKIAWSSEPQNGLVELKGNQLAAAKREAQFNGELRWKELYPKAEITGKEKVGNRDCWVVRLTPTEGSPVTRFYDTETSLLAKVVGVSDTPQGEVEVAVEMSEWQDIGNGIKSPHTIKVTLPGIGDLITRYKEYKYNVEIDDAKFAMPKN